MAMSPVKLTNIIVNHLKFKFKSFRKLLNSMDQNALDDFYREIIALIEETNKKG